MPRVLSSGKSCGHTPIRNDQLFEYTTLDHNKHKTHHDIAKVRNTGKGYAG